MNLKKELEEQRYGKNKQTAINHKYIESGSYRKKFDFISSNVELNRLLYKLAKRMLKHRSGTMYEDMYWIDLDTNTIVASETSSKIEEKIIYSKNTIKAIQGHNNLLTIHSHPNSFPPSISDYNSNYKNKYSIGIVVCHDGKIYKYSAEEEISEKYFEHLVAKYFNQGYTEDVAQVVSLNYAKDRFKIRFEEVASDDNM